MKFNVVPRPRRRLSSAHRSSKHGCENERPRNHGWHIVERRQKRMVRRNEIQTRKAMRGSSRKSSGGEISSSGDFKQPLSVPGRDVSNLLYRERLQFCNFLGHEANM